jgi:isoquinoline 1-oxidoreductase beta subunit
MIGVIELAAEKAGWGRKLPEGWGQGIAFQYGYESYMAEVAEVSIRGDQIRVERVVGAIDCGQVVHPDMVRSQIESGVVFGLSAALAQQITVEGGRVRQSNFHDYPLMRMDEMPVVEAHMVPSEEPPGGVGEAPLPPVAAAVANAISAAGGKRPRVLPLTPAG